LEKWKRGQAAFFEKVACPLSIPTALLLGSRSRLQQARSRGLCPPAGSGSDADVAALAARGEKILAIQLYRELHGGGLKEAKEAVETMVHDIRSPKT
jgi:hypothetical protein